MINILIQYDLEMLLSLECMRKNQWVKAILVPTDVCIAFFDLRAHGLPPVVGVKAKPGS
jgi:hypothetical protein